MSLHDGAEAERFFADLPHLGKQRSVDDGRVSAPTFEYRDCDEVAGFSVLFDQVAGNRSGAGLVDVENGDAVRILRQRGGRYANGRTSSAR
jgi:hypothetical protein